MQDQEKNKFVAIIIGLIIIAIGLLLLANVIFKGFSAELIMAKYWPILLFLFGTIFVASNPKIGIFIMLFSALLLIYQIGLFGTTAGRNVMGLFIMLLGLVLLVTSVGRNKKSDSKLPPPRE